MQSDSTWRMGFFKMATYRILYLPVQAFDVICLGENGLATRAGEQSAVGSFLYDEMDGSHGAMSP